jgi:hypothetical protein
MKNALNALGYPVGRRRAQSLMKEAKIFGFSMLVTNTAIY